MNLQVEMRKTCSKLEHSFFFQMTQKWKGNNVTGCSGGTDRHEIDLVATTFTFEKQILSLESILENYCLKKLWTPVTVYYHRKPFIVLRQVFYLTMEHIFKLKVQRFA